jgi:uncharacterized protein
MTGRVEPLTSDAKGLRLRVRATPKSSRNSVDGLYVGADGTSAIKARVTAAPEKGKANKALITLLAKETGLAPSHMTVIGGVHARNKVILIEGEPEALEHQLRVWLQVVNERSNKN